MRYIDLQNWPRRKHFAAFNAFDFPHFNLCANVDVTAFYPALKKRGLSFTVATVYTLARMANAIPSFRYRIRGERVVEHEIVHPSTTILTEGDLFSFCTIPYDQDFATFATRAAEAIERVRAKPVLEDEPGQDDLLFVTSSVGSKPTASRDLGLKARTHNQAFRQEEPFTRRLCPSRASE